MNLSNQYLSKRFELYQYFYEELICNENSTATDLITENETINFSELVKLKLIPEKHNIKFLNIKELKN